MFSGGRRLTRGMRGSPAPTCCASLPPSTLLHLAERRPAPARSYLPRHSPGLYQHGRHGNADRMPRPPRPPPSSRPPPRRCRLSRPCRTCLHRQRRGADGRPMPRRRCRGRRRRSISLTDTDTIGQSNMKNCRLRTKNVRLVGLGRPRSVIVREKRSRQQKGADSKEE